uniref:Mitochondrial transcription termination factor 4 n=1 Tax=Oryzias sinensis TaxID=183150 RepID=A0A8C7WQT4_9TELE
MPRTSMGIRIAARQIFYWTCRDSSFVFSLPHARIHHLPCLRFGARGLCSSSDHFQSNQRRHEPPPWTAKPVTELSPRSLVVMGFTDSQAEEIYQCVCSIRGEGAARHALSTLTALFVLGLNSSSVVKVLNKCPELCSVKEVQLQQRISNLRKLGLLEGSLQRVVVHYPKILTVPVKSVKNVVLFLKEKCLFTTQQVTDILRDSPAVVLEDKNQLEYKFQYVYFRMGVKQTDMVKCKMFRFTLDELRCRHLFLERRGLYQTPDKKGQTTIINPKLASILDVDQDTFVTSVARASSEEYDVFQKLVAREWKEEGLQGKIEADSDAEEDEEEEEEEEIGGRNGYRKTKKK